MDEKPQLIESIEKSPANEADQAIERSLNRKWDTRVLPVLFLIYFCSFMDRASIGNAAIAGIAEDLDLKGTSYNVALALLFVVYIIVDLPAAWIFAIVGRSRFLAGSIFFWGWVTFSLGFIRNEAQLYALRCLLGFFEGGLTACLFVYLGLFYARYEVQSRIAWFYISGPLSNAVGGLLASGLSQISVGRYRAWRWIFIVEGAFTVLVGVFSYFVLPSWPSKAGYLTAEEKALAESRTAAISNSFGTDGEKQQKLTWRRAGRGIRDSNTVLLSLASLGIYANIYGYSLFSPSIIYSFGFNVVQSELLSAPPYVIASVFILVGSHLSDHFKIRNPFLLVATIIQVIGWTLQLACSGVAARYFGLFLICTGAFGSVPPLFAWLLNNIQPQIARTTALAFTVATGTCGGIISTFTYISGKSPSTGNAMQIGLSGLTLLCTSTLIVYIKRENGKRASGSRNHRLVDGKIPVEELGSHHPGLKLSL